MGIIIGLLLLQLVVMLTAFCEGGFVYMLTYAMLPFVLSFLVSFVLGILISR